MSDMSDPMSPGMWLPPSTLRMAAEYTDQLAERLRSFDTDTLGPSSPGVLGHPGTHREMTTAWQRWAGGTAVYARDLAEIAERLRRYTDAATHVDQHAATQLRDIHPARATDPIHPDPGDPPRGERWTPLRSEADPR